MYLEEKGEKKRKEYAVHRRTISCGSYCLLDWHSSKAGDPVATIVVQEKG